MIRYYQFQTLFFSCCFFIFNVFVVAPLCVRERERRKESLDNASDANHTSVGLY